MEGPEEGHEGQSILSSEYANLLPSCEAPERMGQGYTLSTYP